MREENFILWCDENGYRLDNDWNYQIVKGSPHYWLKNHDKNLYALIKECRGYFTVLVEGFNTFGCFDE